MRRRFAATVALPALVAALSTGAVAAQPLPAATVAPDLGATLQGVLAYARQTNPALRATRFEAEAAAERITPAGALRDPTFQMELRDFTNEASGGGFSLSPANVGSTKYTFRQSFPAWGGRDARRAEAEANADAAQGRTESTWADLSMRIKVAYARYQQVADSLVQARELLEIVMRLESVAQVRYAGGLAPQQDAIRAQVERTATLTEITMLEAELATVRARLNGLLARPPDAPLAEPAAGAALPSLAALDLQVLRERVLARNPQLKTEDARIRAAENNKEAVWANRYPEFNLGVAAIQSDTSISAWELIFAINIPLQQGSRRAQEREALSMLAAAQAKREAVATEALAQLGENLAALEAARRVETLTATALLPQANVTLQSALTGYETAQVPFVAVLDAERQVRQARLTLIRTRAEARVRLAEIERLLGEDL